MPDAPISRPEVVYSERYVAFLDILGFTDAVARSASDPHHVRSIADALQGLSQSVLDVHRVHGHDFKSTMFSDSIILSCAVSKAGLMHLLLAIGDLAISLLAAGLLTRGGLSKGLFYHNDGLAFGPAVLEAYKIENSIARYPRTVLAQSVWEDFNKHWPSGHEKKNEPLVCLGEDGPAFVNIFVMLKWYERLAPERRAQVRLADKQAILYGRLLVLLMQAMHNPNHYEKVRWLAQFWNAHVAENSELYLRLSLPWSTAFENSNR